MDPSDRVKIMMRFADLIEENADELATIEAINNGKPQWLAKVADLTMTHRCMRYYAGWIEKIRGEVINMDGPFFAYTRKEPVGVAGQIIPWNFPLAMVSWKLGPSLAAGCTVVLKTAEQTPLSALRLAELIQEAGFPPGVVNIVSGYGDIGAYLARHPGIEKVAFTGSTEVGYDLMRNSHVSNIKRVTLELGGKSANIITKNANIETALSQASFGLFFNAGQCCNAASRTYVHSSHYEEFVARSAENVKKIKLGDPLDPTTEQGPLVSKDQYDRVMGYIEKGVKEGARLVSGGKRHGSKGYFVEPTVFADVTQNMTIAREEIFGPVMCVLKYENNEDVIKQANDSSYGLAAGVVSEDPSELQYFIDKFKAGTVYANCWGVLAPVAPFGGYKDSGVGR